MGFWLTIKKYLLKLAAKLLPKLFKAETDSLLGKNKGEIFSYRRDNNRNVICLVHGFSGKAKETFFKLPDIIKQDPDLDGWDIISIGYASDAMPTIHLGLWAEQPDILKVSKYLITTMSTILNSYNQIAFVGHSMGGLVIQRALLDMEDIDRNRIDYLLLYGTPSNGLNKASFARWYNTQVRDMDKNGPFIKKLRSDWDARYASVMPFRFVTVAGELDAFVPVESSQGPFPEKYYKNTTGNHVDMVKTDTIDHPSYQILKAQLLNTKPYLKVFTTKELNNMLGDYYQIINSLKGRIDKIDKRAFREYIYALEGFQGIDEAIAELIKDQRVAEDSDFQGILAGRYKRKYLWNYETADKDKAIEFYEKGLQLATTNNDTKQIFYLAINLAFLQLVGNEDLTAMKNMAEMALVNAEKSNDDFWKLATLAEAQLYLGDFEKAKDHYLKAIVVAGDDRRAINSMYINASYSCHALKREDWGLEIENIFITTRRQP